MSQHAAQLHLKYPTSDSGDAPKMTIWDIPRSGLYRVRECTLTPQDSTKAKPLVVETLSPFGWVELIELSGTETGGDHRTAMEIWIAIQTPVPSNQGPEVNDA